MWFFCVNGLISVLMHPQLYYSLFLPVKGKRTGKGEDKEQEHRKQGSNYDERSKSGVDDNANDYSNRGNGS